MAETVTGSDFWMTIAQQESAAAALRTLVSRPAPGTTMPDDTLGPPIKDGSPNPLANNLFIDAFLIDNDTRWNTQGGFGAPVEITFSFASQRPEYLLVDNADKTIAQIRDGFRPVPEANREFYRSIFNDVQSYTLITFREVPDTATSFGQIRAYEWIRVPGDTTLGWGYMPNKNVTDTSPGDIIMAALDDSAFRPGGLQYSTIVHELGHGLGLKHPHKYGNDDTPPFLSEADDSAFTNVMTYSNAPQGNERLDFGLFDTAALRFLYGARAKDAGDTVHKFADTTGRSMDLIIDDGGRDMFDLSAVTVSATIDLRGGNNNFSSVGRVADGSASLKNISILDTSVIENAIGTTLADTFIGNRANNVYRTNGGADTVDGGAGIDTLVLPGARAAAQFNGNQITAGGDTVTHAGIERFRFNDQILAFDTGEGQNAGTVYRVYQAAFNRQPDLPGVSFWTNLFDNGTPLVEITRDFTISPEFRTIYGANPSNRQLVDAFYQNVLGRAGEPGGIDFWIGQLNGGTTVATALSFFANAPENIARTATAVGGGIQLDPGAFLLA